MLGLETACGVIPLSFTTMPDQSAELAPDPIIALFIQIYHLSDIISP